MHELMHTYIHNHCENDENGYRKLANIKMYQYFHNEVFIMIPLLSL